MSGIPGQTGTKPTEVPERYEAGYLEDMDGRVRTARTLRQRRSALVASLGGEDQLSYQELSLCNRIIHLERLIERREMSLAQGVTIDETAYISALNALGSLLTKIGLKRRAKQVQSLSEYVKVQSAQQSIKQ
jgi:hypothetical protein